MSDYNYNIIISEGCTAFYTEINGKVLNDEYAPMSQEEIDAFIDYLCSKFKQELKEGTVNLNDLIQCFQPDDVKYDEHSCEQCGDTVCETSWQI
jgi:hypothetical protein